MRHGESEANYDKSVNRYTPNHMVTLTKHGEEQARQAGVVLQQFLNAACFDETNRSLLFYELPYTRARETTHQVRKGIKDIPGVAYKVQEEPRMREQDFGNFQSTAEVMETIWQERAHYGHFFYRIPYGELAADVYDRVSLFNETLWRQFELDDFPNVLVLVTHGIWARVFLMKWFRWSYEKFESLRNIPNCQYLIMKKNVDDRYELKTPLKTWDDLDEGELDEAVREETQNEVRFNLKGKVTDIEDFEVRGIILAQQKAVRQQRQKDMETKQRFQQEQQNALNVTTGE